MFCINLKEFAPLLLAGKQLLFFSWQGKGFCNQDQGKKNPIKSCNTQLLLRFKPILLSTAIPDNSLPVPPLLPPQTHPHHISKTKRWSLPFLLCREVCMPVASQLILSKTGGIKINVGLSTQTLQLKLHFFLSIVFW